MTPDESNPLSPVVPHLSWMYTAAARRVRDPHLAQDIVQAVLILYWRKRPRCGGEPQLVSWLHRALRYCCSNAQRIQRNQRKYEREAAMNTSLRVPHDADLAEEMELALDRLPEKHRQAILLRFYLAHSFGDVGRIMGIGEDGARKRVERALDALRQHLAAREISLASSSLAAEFVDCNSPAPSQLLEMASVFGAPSASAAATAIANHSALSLSLASLKPIALAAAVAVSATGIIGVVAAAQGPADPSVASTQHAATSALAETARSSGEFVVGGDAKSLVGPEPRIGPYSLTGRSLRLNHALAATGLDLARNQHLHVQLIRRSEGEAERVIELPVSALRGLRDLPLQPNDIVQMKDPDPPATISTGPLQVTLADIVAPNEVITLIEPLDGGEINLPLIPPLRIVGLSPADAAATINRAYRDANLLRDAQAGVVPLHLSGQWMQLGPLQPGQTLELRLLNRKDAPEVRTELTISREGTIDLPGGGSITVAGLTESEAERAVVTAYATPMLVVALHRSTTPLPQEPPKPPVPAYWRETYSIVGTVPKPGRYSIRTDDGPETLRSALAYAGFDPDGNRSAVVAVKRGEDQALLIRRTADLLDDPDADLRLAPGDLVLVPRFKRTAVDRQFEYYLTGVPRSGVYHAAAPTSYRQALTSSGYTPQPGDRVLVFTPYGDGTRVVSVSAADVFAHETTLFDVGPEVILSVSPERP